jgi:hypothetical protein
MEAARVTRLREPGNDGERIDRDSNSHSGLSQE